MNQKVTHKIFGTGHIIDLNETAVEVQFESERKKFIFPDAFGKFLKLHDEQAVETIKNFIHKKEKEKQQMREKRQLHLERNKFIKNLKIHPNSQVVFWCDEDEQNKVFTEGQIFAGVIKSGKNQGTPRKLSRLCPNSACLLTKRTHDEPEQSRRITGVFMVEENFVGKLRDDGYVPAHAKYRLQLTEDEAKKLPFWKYYINKNSPHKTTWNTGKYRYFDNIVMAQILLDIIDVKSDPEEQKLAQHFFDYFCKMNQLSLDDIPEPNGALIQHRQESE